MFNYGAACRFRNANFSLSPLFSKLVSQALYPHWSSVNRIPSTALLVRLFEAQHRNLIVPCGGVVERAETRQPEDRAKQAVIGRWPFGSIFTEIASARLREGEPRVRRSSNGERTIKSWHCLADEVGADFRALCGSGERKGTKL